MSVDLEKHRPVARLLLRLLGILFVIDGASGIISNGLDTFWRVRDYGGGSSWSYIAGTSLAWTLGSLFMFLAGLYLIFKGTAAMDALFHESLSKPAVPCPDCGYDLRATPNAEKCPECGNSLALGLEKNQQSGGNTT